MEGAHVCLDARQTRRVQDTLGELTTAEGAWQRTQRHAPSLSKHPLNANNRASQCKILVREIDISQKILHRYMYLYLCYSRAAWGVLTGGPPPMHAQLVALVQPSIIVTIIDMLPPGQGLVFSKQKFACKCTQVRRFPSLP